MVTIAAHAPVPSVYSVARVQVFGEMVRLGPRTPEPGEFSPKTDTRLNTRAGRGPSRPPAPFRQATLPARGVGRGPDCPRHPPGRPAGPATGAARRAGAGSRLAQAADPPGSPPAP